MWVDDTRIDEMKPVVATFTEETGVKVELVQKASGDIGKDFVAQVPTGEGPDVIISAHDGLGEWVNNGVVAPVELGDKAGDFSDVGHRRRHLRRQDLRHADLDREHRARPQQRAR